MWGWGGVRGGEGIYYMGALCRTGIRNECVMDALHSVTEALRTVMQRYGAL